MAGTARKLGRLRSSRSSCSSSRRKADCTEFVQGIRIAAFMLSDVVSRLLYYLVLSFQRHAIPRDLRSHHFEMKCTTASGLYCRRAFISIKPSDHLSWWRTPTTAATPHSPRLQQTPCMIASWPHDDDEAAVPGLCWPPGTEGITQARIHTCTAW